MKCKRIWLIAILSCIIMLFTACNGINWSGNGITPTKLQLDMPTGLRIESGNLCWNPIEYATRYTVSIDGAEHYCDDYRYPLTQVHDGTHTFRVKANGDGISYTSSAFSEEYSAELEAGAEVEKGYYGQFDELTKNESFLGYGFDVINSSIFSDDYVKMNYPIFDTDELMKQRLIKVDSTRSLVDESGASDMESFMSDWNAKANVNVKWGTKSIGGSVCVEAEYSGGVTNAASKYFHCIYILNQKFYIVMQSDLDTLRGIISSGFEKDLYSDMEPAKLFESYGTHFITSAVMGGKINSYYLYSSAEQREYDELSAKVSAEVRYIVGKTNVKVDGGYSQYASQNNIYVKNRLEVIGGVNHGMLSDSDISENYKAWEASLNKHASLIGIKDTSSLIPIWDLIDSSKDTKTYTWNYGGVSGEGNRSQQLQAYFTAYGIESYNALMEAAALPEIKTPEAIGNVKVNNEVSENNEFTLLVGTDNALSFAVEPADATGYTKAASITSNCEWARIVDEKGKLTLKIDPDAPAGESLEIVLSAGNARKTIKVYIQKKYDVIFVTNGGTEIAPLKGVLHGSQIDQPSTPQKSECVFAGWYKTDNFEEGTKYIFGRDAVKSNLTLFAKWEKCDDKNQIVTQINYNCGALIKANGDVEKEVLPVDTTIKGSVWQLSNAVTQINYAQATTHSEYYIFAGWFTPEGIKLTNEHGELISEVAGYTDKTGRWIADCEVVNLYSRWIKADADYQYIASSEDLKNMEQAANYMLIEDVDLTNVDWEPIKLFTGKLNGNGNIIKGLHCNFTMKNGGDSWGLFISLENAEVTNIIFENVSLNAANQGNNGGDFCLGTLAATATRSSISNITVNGTVSSNGSWGGGAHVGGIVGQVDSCTITDCVNNATVSGAKGSARVGGIAGDATGDIGSCTFARCINNGNVTSTTMVYHGSAYAGGIVGQVSIQGLSDDDKNTMFAGCVNKGTILATKPEGIRYLHQGDITNY